MLKKLFMLLICGLFLCTSGCASSVPADETPSSGLPITEVAPENLDTKLAELSEGAQSEPVLIGYPIRPGYLADLNGDGVYELYANLCFGSGIVDERIQGYDPATDQTSTLSDRAVTDYIMVQYDQALYIIARPYTGDDTAVVCRAVLTDSALACEDIDAELQEAVLAAQEQ